MRISPVSVQPSYFNYTYQAEKISPSPGKNDVVTLLNEHSDFQQAFMKSSSSFSLLDAAEKHTEFSQAYAQDPMAAVARYGIGNSSSGEYVIQYAQGQTIQVLKTI